MTSLEERTGLTRPYDDNSVWMMDDDGNRFIINPTAPTPVVPVWNPTTHSFRRGVQAMDKMRETVKSGESIDVLYNEGFPACNMALGDDIKLESTEGFWLGDECYLSSSGSPDKIVPAAERTSIAGWQEGNHARGMIIPAGSYSLRVTGFLRMVGFMDFDLAPYGRYNELPEEDKEAFRLRHKRHRMEIFGYRPIGCLFWIMLSDPKVQNLTATRLGNEPLGYLDVDSGTISLISHESWAKNGPVDTDFDEDANTTGNITEMATEGRVTVLTTIGDGSYPVYPVYSENILMGYVADLANSFYKDDDYYDDDEDEN